MKGEFFVMKNVVEVMISSSKELKSVRNLVLASLLITVHLLLDLFTIQLLPTLHISFEFLASATIGMLFGPVVGGMCGGLSDIINYILYPKGAFFPGFTISAIVSGLIYGAMLYKKEITLKRCLVTTTLIILIVDIILNTYWLSILYKNAFLVLFGPRLIKNLVMIPINTILMYIVLKKVKEISVKFNM